MRQLLIIGLVLLMLCGVASAGLETQYTYNWTHYINGSSSGTLTNYPVTLVMFNTSGTSTGENFYEGGSYTNANWSDVAFSQDGTTALPMWLETASPNATSARFWVNMSSITNGTTNQTPLYIYFGNASKTSASNINTTFPFGDDFNEATLNTTKWTSTGSPAATVSGGIVNLAGKAGDGPNIIGKKSFGVNFTMRMLARTYAGVSSSSGRFGGYTGTPTIGYTSIVTDDASRGAINGYPRNGGNGMYLNTTGSFGNWYIFDIIRNGSYSVTYNVGTLTITTTNTSYISLNTMPIDIDYYNSASMHGDFNWVLVRPYTYPEPTHGSYLVAPIANFTANQTSGTSPLNVSFIDTSLNNPTSWSWDFGDGNTSTYKNTTHLYYTGNWSVNFSATNALGTNWKNGTWINVTAGVSIPVANFTANQTSGVSPLNVLFNDTSTNVPTSWNWSFGDGNYSTTQNTTHLFYTGNWSVNLSATNTAGTGYKNGTWVNVTSGVVTPVASFTSNWVGSLPIPRSITFNDTSSNTPTSWEWNFGDKTTNVTTQNVTYKWTKRGYWTVTMTATNIAGSSSNYTNVRVVGG